MNASYTSIWNESTGTYVAASENAKTAGKKASGTKRAGGSTARFELKALAVSLMLSFGGTAFAAPAGGVVTAGSATINSGAGNTLITQTTQNAAINWLSFNIAAGESVKFVQPTANSVALNRVLGSDPSNILGSLTANGKVFLVNPNGILFGQGASINVGGLVASTLNVTDSDFMAGSYQFAGAGKGSVVNQGSINASGGFVALLGANVANNGVIVANLGTVALAAGNAMTLDVAGDGLLNVTVNQGVVNALVQNGGLIQSDGGQVMLTAQAAGSLMSSAVNNTGVIQAQTLVNRNGKISLLADMQKGTVNVIGTLDASAPNGGDGGFIETSAAHVKVADGAHITTRASTGKTGNWLIDPSDYAVSATGNITGAALSTALDLNNVTLQSSAGSTGTLGNVNVNDPVSWTATTTLAMNAVNDVNIAAAVTGINGSVVATAGHDVNVSAATKTTTGMLSFTAVNDVAITAATTVITGNMTAVAGHDVKVSAASTITTGDMIFIADNDGTGPGVAAGTVSITCGSNCLTITTGHLKIRFNPVSYASTGAEITAYGSHLTGAGVLDAKAWVFGKGDNKMYDGTTAATVSGMKADTGGVVPAAALGAVTNAVFDNRNVGAAKLITYNSTLTDPVYELFAPFGATPGSYTTRADVLVRPLTINAVTDTRVYNGSTSSTGTPTVIALQPGDTLTGPLTQSYASKNVLGTGASTLVATGPYTVADGNGGNNYVVSVNTAPGTITPLALVGSITAPNKVYDGNNSATIATRALTTPVSGDAVSYVGGTALFSDQNVANGKTVTGTGFALGGADAGNYSVNTSASTTANITPAPLTVTANSNAKVYGQTFTPAATAFTTSALVNGETVGSVTETSPGSAATAPVVGSPYAITPSGATGGTFTPSNYTISYINGVLTVAPAPLTVTANDVAKSYGDTPALSGFTTTALKNGETVGSVTETSPGQVATAPVAGSPYAITPNGATGGSFTPSNYTISYVNGVLTVAPAPLTVTANDVAKNYGDTPALSGFTTTALKNGETVGSVTEISPGQVATAPVAGSPYAITPSGATGGSFTQSNYTISYANGVLSVAPAPLTVTASNVAKNYGDTPALTGFTTTALKNGETVGSVTESSPGSVATALAAGSPYAITPSGATGGTFTPSNYTIAYNTGVLTVTPAVVPPIVTPPVAVLPVEPPPVVTPPVVVPPVEPPPVVTPPVVVSPVEPPPVVVPPTETPPVVVPPVTPVTWVPVVTPPARPSELLTLVPPAPVVAPAPLAPVPVFVPAPNVTPVAAPPALYVAPVHLRKQDRN